MHELSLKEGAHWCIKLKKTWEKEKKKTHRRNSGVALYLSNSSSHSARESGGRTPVIGRHSVMLSPDSVRRVTPPTTMTARTRTEESKSQFPTAGGESTGSCWFCCCADAAGSSSAPLDEKNRGSSTDLCKDVVMVGPRSENAAREYCRAHVRERVRIGARVEKDLPDVVVCLGGLSWWNLR